MRFFKLLGTFAFSLLPILGVTHAHSQSVAFRASLDRSCETVLRGEVEVLEIKSETVGKHPVTVEGLLMRAPTDSPVPAIVMLHTANGMEPPDCYGDFQRMLREWGYASFLLDHASGGHAGNGREFEASAFDRISDLKGAVVALRHDQRIDAERLGVIGWSRGALTLLLSMSPQRGFSDNEPFPFKAAAAYYPTCPRYLESLPVPLLLFHGDRDKDAPIKSCRALKAPEGASGTLSFFEYQGADHLFDFPHSSAFNRIAAEDSWRRIRVLFDQN